MPKKKSKQTKNRIKFEIDRLQNKIQGHQHLVNGFLSTFLAMFAVLIGIYLAFAIAVESMRYRLYLTLFFVILLLITGKGFKKRIKGEEDEIVKIDKKMQRLYDKLLE